MPETDRIEYKQRLTDGLEKEVVAFLNATGGGTVYIGVDKAGNTVGIQNVDSDALKIKDRLKHKISPSCLGLFDLVIEEKDGQSIIKILVASGAEKPYHLTKYGMTPRGVFLRVGTAAEPMNQRMIDDLFAKRTRHSIGRIKANRQDLTFQQLKIYYQEIGATLNDKFAHNLELLTDDGKYNYVGYLLADENAVSIKVAKYAGTDKTNLIENEEYGYCSLIKATNQVLAKLEVENKTFTKITGEAQRREQRMIDRTALREALINAMVHNDYTREVPPVVEIYSDRLSITSYGGLVYGLSKEEFFEGRSMPRNRELMRVFKDLQFVENLGSGIHRILARYDKSIFKISEHFLEICFPFAEDYMLEVTQGNQKGGQIGGQISPMQKDEFGKNSERVRNEFGREVAITFEIISVDPYVTASQIAKQIGKTTRTVEKHISKLKEGAVIERVGPNLGGYWKILIS